VPDPDASTTPRPVRAGVIRGGRVVEADGSVGHRDLAWRDGRIVAAGSEIDSIDGPDLDAAGRWVLPGIVDLHGDAFERSLMPRPGVHVPIELALADNDSQLVSAGITTSFLSATDGWEPGLRSRATLTRLIDQLDTRRGSVDTRLHVRHEVCLTDGHAALLAWIEGGRIDLLSINDHTPDRAIDAGADRVSSVAVGRAGVTAAELSTLTIAAIGRRDEGRAQVEQLAAAARMTRVPVASHDALDERHLDHDVQLGVQIAEFPATLDLAAAYRRHNISVLLGAPNLVRGGSHLDNLDALDAIESGVVDALCSDYHYPSLVQAPFVLARRGVTDMATAWALVSSRPAAAAGLDDRGTLDAGQRADIVVIDDDGPTAAVDQVVVDGDVMLSRR